MPSTRRRALRRSLRRRTAGRSSSPPARPPAQMVPGPSCSRDTGACEAGRKRAAPTHARGAAQPPAQSLQSSRVRGGGYGATPTPSAGCGSRCNTATPSWTHAVEAWASAGSAGPPMGFGRFGVGTVGGLRPANYGGSPPQIMPARANRLGRKEARCRRSERYLDRRFVCCVFDDNE